MRNSEEDDKEKKYIKRGRGGSDKKRYKSMAIEKLGEKERRKRDKKRKRCK